MSQWREPEALAAATEQSTYQFCRGGVRYRRAEAEDDASLKALLRENAMDSWVKMTLEREPRYAAGENILGVSTTVIAEEEHVPCKTIGMYSHTLMPVHMNGKAIELGYLGELRVNVHNRNKIRLLKMGYDSVKGLTEKQLYPYCFTSVARDNPKARRLLEAGLRGLPLYRPQGEYETFALSTQYSLARHSRNPLQHRRGRFVACDRAPLRRDRGR